MEEDETRKQQKLKKDKSKKSNV
jgi:hypothetical protein